MLAVALWCHSQKSNTNNRLSDNFMESNQVRSLFFVLLNCHSTKSQHLRWRKEFLSDKKEMFCFVFFAKICGRVCLEYNFSVCWKQIKIFWGGESQKKNNTRTHTVKKKTECGSGLPFPLPVQVRVQCNSRVLSVGSVQWRFVEGRGEEGNGPARGPPAGGGAEKKPSRERDERRPRGRRTTEGESRFHQLLVHAEHNATLPHRARSPAFSAP